MIARLLSLAFLAATPTLAQSTPDPAPPPDIDPDAVVGELPPAGLGRDRITVALGAAVLPGYEGSDTSAWTPAGFAQGTVGGYAFQLRGPRLSVDALRNRPGPGWDLQLGPAAGLNLDRTRRGRIDDPRVVALGERKTAVELGGFAGLGRTGVLTSPFDRLTASVTAVRDVAGAHRGTLITPALDYGTPLSTRAFVGVTLAATHISGRYADTYFTVTPAGGLAGGLPAFTAGGGWKDWSLALVGLHALTGDLLHGLGLAGGVRYGRLLNDAARSPVTSVAGDRDQWSGTIGLAYTF